jgi:hypothetical protein
LFYLIIPSQAFDEGDPENKDDDESDDESSSSSEDDKNEVNNTTAPKKGRILKAFEDSDDEVDSAQPKNDAQMSEVLFNTKDCMAEQPITQEFTIESQPKSLDYLNSQSSFKVPSVSQNLDTNRIDNLFDPKVTQSQTIEDVDLMEICSGQFAPTQDGFTQKPKVDDDKSENFDDFISQVSDKPEEQQTEVDDDDFVTQVDTQKPSENFTDPQMTPDLVFSSDFPPSEDIEEIVPVNTKKLLESSEEENEEVSEKKKKKLKKRRKKNMKLAFSDDENEESETENLEMEEQDDFEEVLEEEEAADVCVNYDSEENDRDRSEAH